MNKNVINNVNDNIAEMAAEAEELTKSILPTNDEEGDDDYEKEEETVINIQYPTKVIHFLTYFHTYIYINYFIL